MARNYIITFFCTLLFASGISAQSIQHQTSYPVNIPFESVSKLALLQNGTTLLFSFKQNKDIRVKVFDTLHNEIADEKVVSKYLNEYRMDKADIKGLYAMNNEAVIFIGQNRAGKTILVRLRVDTKGKICGEDLVSDKCLEYWLVNNGRNDGYSILFVEDVITKPENNIRFANYNNKHNKIAETIVNFDASNLSGLSVVGAEKDFYGNTCLMFNIWQKTVSGKEKIFNKRSWLLLAYMPANEDYFSYKLMPHGNDTIPEYFRYGYDIKNKRLNLFLVSKIEKIVGEYTYYTYPANLFSLDATTLNVVYDEELLYYYDAKQLEDGATQRARNYTPVHLSIDDEGIASVIAETIYFSSETKTRTHATNRTKEVRGQWEYTIQHYWSDAFQSGSTRLGDINITRFDTEGNVVGGHIIPKSHAINNTVKPFEIVNRKRDKDLFTHNPFAEIVNQYVSFDFIKSKTGNTYILYNDDQVNFDKGLSHPTNTVYNYQNSNAICNTISNGTMSKTNLLGEPEEGINEAGMIETSYFDYHSGTYVLLYSQNNGKNTTYKIAWASLK